MVSKIWNSNSTSVKLSCETNFDTGDQNGDTATATYRALRGEYGLRNRSTTQAIGKKFEKTGVVTNI